MTREFLLYLVIDVISSVLVYKAFQIFFKGKEKYKHSTTIIAFVLYHFSIIITHSILDSPNMTMVVNVLFLFLIANCFDLTLKKKIVFVVLFYSILMIIESILVLGCFYITNTNSIVLGYAISQVTLIVILGVLNQKRMTMDEIVVPKIQLVSVVFFPLGGLIIFAFVEKYTPEVVSLFALVILLIFDILIMSIFEVMNKEYSLKLSGELKLQEKQLESKIYYREKHYYENQLKIINESQGQIRTLKHDLKTHQFAMKSLLENNQIQDALRYLNQISNSIEANHLNYIDTNNIHIDSILNYKISLAANKNILIRCQIKIPDHLDVEPFDISVILGNLLDNAIEAEELRKCKNKVVDLTMKYDRGCFYLKITNKFTHNLNRVNGIFHTHKEDVNNHGLGLKSVQRSVEKYNGILSFDVKDDVFCAKVFLYL